MDQERTYKWIQDRLRELHSGTLTEADWVRLIEIAKTDPFVQDALDGYHAHSNHDHSVLLRLMSQRIQNKSASRRPKLMPLSRGLVLQALAASFVVILATWAVIYYMGKTDEAVFVATEIESSPYDERTTEVTLTQPDSMNDMVMSPESSVDGMESEPSGLRANAQAKIQAEAIAKAEVKAKEYPGNGNQEAGTVTDVEVKETDTYTFSDPVPPSSPVTSGAVINMEHKTMSEPTKMDANVSSKTLSRDEGYYANQMDPTVMQKRVTGKVVSQTGEPLIGVNLAIQNTNLGTITDNNGSFELFLPSKESQVDVMYSGYVDASIKLLQGTDDVIITLPQSSKNSEQVVVAAKETTVPLQNVPAGRAFSPTRGKDTGGSYTDYIRQNTRIPIQENLNAPAKEVMLEFIVSNKGRPEQIKVVRSSNQKDYDEEAVRLIRKGPEWECEMGLYPCTARYTIYFQ